MFVSSIIGIIADDLTGANDTALQFHLEGCNTQIIPDYESLPENRSLTQAWAVSTETRNIDAKSAVEVVERVVSAFKDEFNVEFFYKKIDSTLRGNIAVETLKMLEVLELDAAVIAPAFPAEGRSTVGGYQLMKGVPIERTEMARDPHSPIYESYVPKILMDQLGERSDLIGFISLQTVMKGAGPIAMKLNDLISEGKKLIVVDAVSTTDMEQIALASQKSKFEILPCGSAGYANVLADIWVADLKYQHIHKTIPKLPKLILSGSATDLAASQIKRLTNEEIQNTYFINLKLENVVNGLTPELLDRVLSNLKDTNVVTVHSSYIQKETEENPVILTDKNITRSMLAGLITDLLAQIAGAVLKKTNPIFITIGGETSYKCAKAMDSKSLQVVDAVLPAIPLCINTNADWIVTKSGNLGNTSTLIDIIKYFQSHE